METVLEEWSSDTETKREEEELSLRNMRVSVLVDSSPESYRTNSPEEVRLLAIVDSFQRQYSHLYPDRTPLLLCPVNECGVKKFVCTTLRATPSAFPELLSWQGCAAFVADFLCLELLQPPAEVPRHMSSSTLVLQTQRATCFESATLLCSLLLGAHYDAYCVSGYAVKQMCLLDQSLQDCPLLDTKSEISEQQENESTVSPSTELKSRFLIQQEKKKQEAEAELLKQKLQEETQQQTEDPLQGLRVHCWILVLSGSRSIQENFFIDPLTGSSYSTSDDKFLGIESVWNNLNYYVNMQDCSTGCADMRFDLEDDRMWEPVLFGATSKKQLILDVIKKKEKTLTQKMTRDEEEEDEEPRVFKMPRAWLDHITISKKDLETRWPKGHKVTQYRKAKLEKFAPYLRADGLVTQLTTYTDSDCAEVATVKKWFQHRSDHLEQKELDLAHGFTTDRFRPGRSFSLLVHRYKTSEFQHDMDFSTTHVDNLVRREVSTHQMTEVFEGRPDFLYYRHVVFDPHMQFSDTVDSVDPNDQTVQKVVERFHRNRSKAANEDVEERVFLVAQRRVEVTYHLEDHRFIPSKRSFIKPEPSTEEKKEEDFVPAMVSSFQVEPSEKPPRTLALYHMLQALVKAENQALLQISKSIKEVRDIMVCREQEQSHITLPYSCWTTTAAAGARKQREEMETLELQKMQEWYQKNQLNISDEQKKQYENDCVEKLLQIHVAKERLDLHKEQAHYKFKNFNQKLKQDPRLVAHLLS
ncbi:dynein regulatory complex subunit 7 isoform X2 [Betta splendens]|uniref:Dynein regulatory complex subunit 7 n=1 Tax=Betta splendens TaxID=158456 RepID=A0A8M1HGF4_BETSP|nr:dynein regulatory complex subunit 7 isoform X2 [Betta splendens]